MDENPIELKPRIGCLVLAAGASLRLGSPKQLLIYDGKTLLRRSVETAINAGFKPVIVVLGSEIERSRSEISGLDVKIHINEDWESGMSSSIKAGLEHLLKIEPEIDGVLITLCDQPKVSSEHLNLFVEKFEVTKASIIAAQYEGVAGVTALFSK
ncbi:MAG: nucleotidyltransferase family protein [Saprospiraceae bacterium]|nr:nucleotidyltransferase family protein [Pyrinomonadaceae bacterium]